MKSLFSRLRDRLAHETRRSAKRSALRDKALAKQSVVDQRQQIKRLITAPPAGWSELLLLLRHPRAFWKGGLAAAYEASEPAIRHPDYREAYNRSIAQYVWDYYHQKSFFRSIRWMGIVTLKSVQDLWVYQEILYETKPDLVVEIGSLHGGSTLFFAHMMDLLGHGEVISIDIVRDRYAAGHPRIHEITGDSSSTETLDAVKRLAGGRTVMLVHDGDHSEEAVRRDLESYAPLVSKGHYLVVEDGIVELFNPRRLRTSAPSGGPLSAVDDFLRHHPEFELDRSREKFTITSNPHGFLKRKA